MTLANLAHAEAKDKPMRRNRKLNEAGFKAAIAGLPCEAPTNRELDRASWEIGWRSGHAIKDKVDHVRISAEAHRKCSGSVQCTYTDGGIVGVATAAGIKVFVDGLEV